MTNSPSLQSNQSASVLDAPIPADEQVPDVDEQIKKRLEVMKQPINDLDQPFSDRTIAERLANLKDVPHKEYDNRAMINAVDTRTEHQMANDLVEQFMKEVNLDEAVKSDYEDPIESIERRLAALKGSPGGADQKPPTADSNDEHVHDEETLAKKIVNKVGDMTNKKNKQWNKFSFFISLLANAQYLDEAALPDSDLTPEEKEFVNSIKPEQPTEELPWCTICNEDATIRCIGCDDDLFCRPCFKEIHDNDEEYRGHRTKPFVAKETQTQWYCSFKLFTFFVLNVLKEFINSFIKWQLIYNNK